MKEETRKRLEELERRIRELEARPPQTVYVHPPVQPHWVTPPTFVSPTTWPNTFPIVTCGAGVATSVSGQLHN